MPRIHPPYPLIIVIASAVVVLFAAASGRAAVYAPDGAKIAPVGYVSAPALGTSVAVSGDGKTLASGGNNDNGNKGAVWVYTKDSAARWTQQGGRLIGTGMIGTTVHFGSSVALSFNGSILATGGHYDNSNVGATWIFTRLAGLWAQATKLVGSGYNIASGYSFQGVSVAMSATGGVVVVGAHYDTSELGAWWIFTLNGTGGWSQAGGRMQDATSTGTCWQGIGVACSSNCSTIAVGGSRDTASDYGAAWIYTTTSPGGGVWSKNIKLTVSPQAASAYFGYAVALSADGATLAASAIGSSNYVGGFYTFTRSANTGAWGQQGPILVG